MTGIPVVDETDDLLTSVARLYYLDGLGQQEICGMIGVSRSTVSRLLTAARQRGVVRISVAPYDPRARDLEHCLIERFGLHHAFVVKTHGRAPGAVRRAVGYFAAPAVSELITPPVTVGVTGGRTLSELVSCMEPSDRESGLIAVQLMGNIAPAASRINALELSRVLAGRFDGTHYIVNAPAFAQDHQTRDLFMAHEHIRLVWGLFNSLKLAFVGIGSPDESAIVEHGTLGPTDIASLHTHGAVGEVCGRFFDAEGHECDTELRDRVISVELDALRRCPEVIGVTNGPQRACAVRAAIRGRLINSLVIDQQGAEAVLAEGGAS